MARERERRQVAALQQEPLAASVLDSLRPLPKAHGLDMEELEFIIEVRVPTLRATLEAEGIASFSMDCAVEDKIAAAAAMAAEAQVHRLLLISSCRDLSLMSIPYGLVLALDHRATRRRPCCIMKAQSSGCNFFPKL